jgi:hypothetical protein
MEMKKHTLVFGAELFRQAFMAVDYVEMRLMSPHQRRKPSAGGAIEQGRTLGIDRDHNSQSYNPEKRHLKNPSPRERRSALREFVNNERGDVPGWVLVVLMTTGLVTAIWAVAAPRLNAILKNSLDSMNNIR